MADIDCPLCSDPILIGLPNDATIEDVVNESVVNTNADTGIKTRKVSCSDDHDVFVTFETSVPDQSIVDM
jgi:hypothetical protein